MKWKEIIFGALITLIITIIAGITVWKLTKEPTKPDPVANVVFESDSPAHFESKSKNLMFNTVRIGNLGDKTAHKVTVSIEFPEETNILDFTISNSSGNAANGNHKELDSKKSEKLFSFDMLMPDEVVTISILTDGYEEDSLNISSRYDEGVGESGKLSKRLYIKPDNSNKSIVGALVAMLLGLFVAYMYYRLRGLLGGSRSKNNSAFMLLHQGLINEATQMFESEFNSRGVTSYEIANLGLCKGLSGEREKAEQFYKSAELYSSSKNIKALVEFNRALSYFNSDETEKAKKHFLIAVEKDESMVKNYIKYSVYAFALVNSFEEFQRFIPKGS